MEILSPSFVFFLIQLSLCVLPILVCIKLLFLVKNKQKIRQKISTQLLGEPELLQPQVFNVFYYSVALILLLLGVLFIYVFIL